MSYEPQGSGPFADSADVPGGGTDKRLIARLVLAAVLVALVIVFIVQNSERVETTFVFFTVTTRLWVGLVVALVLGAVLGRLAGAVVRRRRRARDD